MKRIIVCLAILGTLQFFVGNELIARGPGGGGGGGGARAGGGGAARPSGGGAAHASNGAGRSPAISGAARPSPGGGAAANRPNTGGGNVAANRPNVGGGNVAANRPNVGGGNVAANRPNVGGGNVAANQPAVGAGAARPSTGAVTRPSAGQLNDFIDVGRPSTGAIAGARPGAGGAAGDFLQQGNQPAQLPAGGAAIANRPSQLPANPGAAIANRPSQLPANPGAGIAGRPGVGTGVGIGVGAGIGAGVANNVGSRAGDRRQNLADNRPSRVENRQQLQDNRVQRRDEVRDQVRNNYPRLGFWADHANWARWRINAPYRWATWAALTGWFGWGAAYTENSYAYGDNVYYVDNSVYYGDAPVATAEQYADQAAAIAASAPHDLNPANSDWMPLGVFAATQDREATGPDPTLFLQLAVNKDGVISGTFKNMATGDMQTIEGMIDKKSQRAAWCVEGKSWPIVETGLSNLTQDTAPVLVHFADGETQQWLLVRLPEPTEK